MANRIFIIQSKGGVGKSYLTKLFALKATKEKKLAHFIDCDNASASTSKFFAGIPKEKKQFLKLKSENLLGIDRKIDRTKFDSFIETVSKLDNVICDFGAASSEQLLYYIQEESGNDVIEVLKELGITFYLVVAGGGSIKECFEYVETLVKVKGMKELTVIVANEYLGGVNGKSVKEFSLADIQITSLQDDRNSEAQKEWDNLMNNGITYEDITLLPIMRRRRIINYLDKVFETI